MSAQPRDQEQRIVAATWTRGPVLVEAGAGTGKTTLLVERILHLIRSEGASLDEIAAITFTRKATAELKDRIRGRLIEAVPGEQDAEARTRLQDALDNLESARISTIHGFALNILQGFSVEAGLRPDLGDVDEIEYEARRDTAWRDWLALELDGDDAPLRDFLELGFQAADLAKIRDALLELPELREHFPRAKSASPDEIHAEIEEAFDAWAEVGERHCTDETDKAYQEIEKARDWLEGLFELSQTELLRELWSSGFKLNKRVGSAANWGDSKEEGGENLKLFRVEYDRFLQSSASLIAHEMLAGLVPLVRGFVEAFERDMREAGLLSYQDMLFLAAKLVRENASVRGRIHEDIKHFLVDEFQDTDPLQVELIFLLAGEGDAADWREVLLDDAGLFLVGDPKQSIYRFRRADIAVYHEVKDMIEELPGGRRLHITENFRSAPGVVDFVNEAFSRAIVHDPGNPHVQPEYVELMAHRESEDPAVFLIRKEEDGNEPEDGGRVNEEERRKAEAACLAAAIRELVEEKRAEITDRDNNARRPVQYGDVAVLFRTRTGYPQFEDAFRGAGVPFVTDGGYGFYDKFEVGAVVSVLAAVARPGDSLALAAALRSPLYGFSDVEIARYFLKTQEPPEELKEAVREIRLLHEVKKNSSARAMLEEIYRRTGAFELFLASSGGEQRVANLVKLLDTAHEFAAGGRRGADAFAAHLEAQYELGREAKEPEAFLDARGSEAVRFMTIHQAKGLEFPVVALADLESKDDQRSESRVANHEKGNEAVELHLGSGARRLDSGGYSNAFEREKGFHDAEIKRLWYVGATRAEDYLLWPESGFRSFMKVTGLGEEEIDEVIRTASASVLEVSPVEAREAESILRLGDEVFRPVNGGSAGVVDRRAALDEKLRLLKKPVEAPKPLAPSSLVKGFDGKDPALYDEDAPQVLEVHAGGAAFGSLVHEILARLEPPAPERLESLREEGVACGRALGLKEDNVDLAMKLIRNSAETGILARAAVAPRRWRELPFVYGLGGRVLRGAVDLVFEEEGKLVVVDFKTDRITEGEAEDKAADYESQGAAYVMALEAATGLEVGELVFSFLRPGVDVSWPVDDMLRQRVREAVAEAL
ncbi:MAG: UvrD-helicase domain-containing protein [Nitrospinae bacterium]|nr:UvrD-helicase domain-containing protein [Nitrospinota bacterium]